jgi:hypothetical protein
VTTWWNWVGVDEDGWGCRIEVRANLDRLWNGCAEEAQCFFQDGVEPRGLARKVLLPTEGEDLAN